MKIISDWSEKLKSDKEVLLKVMVQAVPTYAMPCFKLSNSLCRVFSSLRADFWWGLNGDMRKIHWINWPPLCKPKMKGGMGFREF